VLEIHANRIRELCSNKKYKNTDDFMKSAIEILLTWESEHPEECMQLMRNLMPFSPYQEAFMKQSMVPNELEKQFGILDIDKDQNEISQQKILGMSDEDHLKLRDNFQHTLKYVKALKITKPKNVIPYDGHPVLSGFYSRLLPVKIVITVLGHILERKKSSKVELKDLRLHGYDIAEEIAGTLSKYEKAHDIPRNEKMSTGLPKKGSEEKDEEKKAMAQKRFKDQFVGKVRKSRVTKTNHFEGALSALGLVYATQEEEDKVFVSLTELGKKFFLIENPVVQGEYEKGPLTKQEADFILKELIPQRELEKQFVDTAVSVIERIPAKDRTTEDDEKITYVLDVEFLGTAKKYLDENPKVLELYNINHLDSLSNELTKRKITQWRLATMGRLAELKVVKWEIDDKGDSKYTLLKPLAPQVKA